MLKGIHSRGALRKLEQERHVGGDFFDAIADQEQRQALLVLMASLAGQSTASPAAASPRDVEFVESHNDGILRRAGRLK